MTRIKNAFELSVALIVVFAATVTVTAFIVVPSSHGTKNSLNKHHNINIGVHSSSLLFATEKRSSRTAAAAAAEVKVIPGKAAKNKKNGIGHRAAVDNNDDDKNNNNNKSINNNKSLKRALAGFVLTVTIAATSIGGFPLPSNAGFGPSSGATTTSPPNLNSFTTTAAKTAPGQNAPTTEFNVDLDGKKLKILIDSALNVRRLEEFSGQLDVVIQSLRDSVSYDLREDDEGGDNTANTASSSQYYDATNPYITAQRQAAELRNVERERDLLQAQNLQLRIQGQEKMLTKLQNQPYWFNYFAAFVGSTVSTLIMHPIDTIKTRIQIAGVRRDDDDDDDNDDEEEEKNRQWQQSQSPSLPSLESQPYGSIETNFGSAAIAVVDMNMNTTATTTMTAPSTATATATMTAATTATTTTAVAATTATKTTTEINLGGSGGGLYDDLYEGLTGNLWKEVPPSAIYLGIYETVKYALAPKVAPAYLLWVYLIAGAAGETVGSVIRAPAEAVKSLVQSKDKDNALEALKSVVGTPDGRENVIRAWTASIGRDVPFGAIQLAVFETIKASILNNPNIELDSSTLLFEAIIGAFAGGLGAYLTNPLDVITTRIITQDLTTTTTTTGGENNNDDVPSSSVVEDYDASSALAVTAAPLGVLDMGKKIYDEDGFGAFFAGWTARVGYWAPAISIFLTCYCSVRQAGISYDLFS